MFWRKNKKKTKEKKELSVKIQTIPDVFYGGKDPEIYHTRDLGESVKKDEKKVLPKKKAPQKKTQTKSKKKIIIISSVSFVVVVGAISWYYIAQYNSAKRQLENPPEETPVVEEIPTVPDVVEIPEVVTSTTEVVTSTEEIPEIVTSSPALESVFLEFPPLLLLDTTDLDGDGLTDIEEELFDTDSGTWDSDSDGYFDGQEIFNLYNPRGFAPVKLIDSGLVQEYINPLGYRVYYPLAWQTGDVDPKERQVLFSAISGDYVEIRAVEKKPRQTFVQWFGQNAEGQFFNDLKGFTNRFEQEGWYRRDSLVAYFEGDNYVYVILYHPKDRAPVAYRHVVQMMYQGFRVQKTNIELPDQELFPGLEEVATGTSEGLLGE
ncbi:hypothetical protein C0581_04530 [Candidatus Parcubacteria bacterium]|nr:MAG: hypothetical protein C0581_04530 [Candidatus Parcubacteria bacterium]